MVKLNNKELFPVVDEDGIVIGSATRQECHSGAKLLHPVVHLHVFDKDGKLFLQKRSMTKDIQPGKWDTAVGGHVDYEETVPTALLREAEEELSLAVRNPEKLYTYVFESDVERELVNTFRCTADESEIAVDPDEISEGRFFTMAEVESMILGGLTTPNFALEFGKLKNIITDK